MSLVFLSLGSNKVLKKQNEEILPVDILRFAVKELSLSLQNISISSVYKTKPMYFDNQEYFYNMVVSGAFSDEAQSLLKLTQNIEHMFGRNRREEQRNGPRTLDIDILLFSDLKMHSENLIIPHPKMNERAFVLVPMLEILHKIADIKIRDYYSTFLQNVDTNEVIKFCTL